MSDISIRIEGRAGRITLTRPKALNALSHEMCLAIEGALDAWRDDARVALIVLDAEGERAFCAGGDIEAIYREGIAGELENSRKFWADEYRMNAKMARYPKPIISLMQGFVMGGGVGIGGHCSHRIVGDTSQVAMPECGIGLIPDVGGTLLLARAPGRLGEYLGLTGARMGAGDAIHAGFADHYLPEGEWPALIADLVQSGDAGLVATRARATPASPMAAAQGEIDALFAGQDLAAIFGVWPESGSELATRARKALDRGSPLSMACTLELLRRARAADDIRAALAEEYRFTYRAIGGSDLLEGIRAAVIDKDRNPKWRHANWEALDQAEAEAMLAPLGAEDWAFEEGKS